MKHPLQVYHAHQASASLYHPYKASASHESPYAAHTVSTYTRYSTTPPCMSFSRKRSTNGPVSYVQTASAEGWSYSSIHASAPRARHRMPEDITKGELVRVIARGTRLKCQQVQVLAIEHGTIRKNRYSDTWYLLDTRTPNHSTSFPAWFERHEIERVTPEDRGVAG